MSSSFILSLIILAVLAASFHFLVMAQGGYSEIPQLLQHAGVSIDWWQ